MSMSCSRVTRTAFGLLATVAAAWAGTAQAQSAADFYKGKTINIIVGFAPGGGYDAYARLLARHIGQHIPGNPSVIVQNMPGAAGIVASNNVYNLAPKDGTVIAAVDQNIPMVQLLGGKGVRYDIAKVNWLGTMAYSNGVAVAWHESPVKTLEDAKSRQVIFGTTGGNDSSYIFAVTMNHLIGTKFRPVKGYSGTSAVNLAIERGEVEAMGRATYLSLASQKADWLRDKKLNFLVQIGFEKQPELADVPLLSDLVEGEEAKQIAALITLPSAVGYSHWMAPEIPTDRLAAMRDAYQAALKDPALVAEAQKAHLDIRPKTAKEMAAAIKMTDSVPAPIRQKTADLLEWD